MAEKNEEKLEKEEKELAVEILPRQQAARGRYRDSISYKKASSNPSTKGLSYAIVAMIAIMVVMAGITMYSKGMSLADNLKTFETLAGARSEQETEIPVEKIYK